MNKLWTAVLSGMLMLSPVSWAETTQVVQEVKMGVVDLQQVLESKIVKDRFASLDRDFESRQKDFEASRERLYQMNEDLKRDAVTMTQMVRESRETEIKDMWNKLQQQGSEMQAEYTARHQKIQADFLEQIEKESAKLAKRYGLQVVHKQQAILFIDQEFNLTEEIIRSLR